MRSRVEVRTVCAAGGDKHCPKSGDFAFTLEVSKMK